MRMKEIQRYLDRFLDRDAFGDRIDALQDRLNRLRDHMPDLPASRISHMRDSMRDSLPSYRDIRRKLPFAPAEPRSYTLPAALAVGGIAILGAIVVTAVMTSNAHKRTPKKNEDMGENMGEAV